MSIKIPFLINSIEAVNPEKDKRWVPESEHEWFLPCALDLKNQTYSGWWYASKNSHILNIIILAFLQEQFCVAK